MADKAPPPHRTQIPNIVDDLGLDPYERALYVHYKRVCGENQGAYCYEAVKTTAHKVKMSTGQVSEARKQLAKRGLILIQDGRPVIVTVANIWDLNTAFYQLEHRPDVDGWTVEQLKLWLSDVHTVNVSSHNDSKLSTRSETNLTEDDKDVHTVNVNSPREHSLTDKSNMSSNVHTVKQRRVSSSPESSPKKESERESPPSKQKGQRELIIPAYKVFVEVTEYYAITKHWRGELARIVGEEPDDLEFFRKVCIGWTGKYPTKHNVEGMLDYYKRREIPGQQQLNGKGSAPPSRSLDPDKEDTYYELEAERHKD